MADGAGAVPVAWSHGLLTFNLVLALGYPVLALMVNWAVTGEGRVAGLTIVPPLGNDFLRWVTIGGIAGWIAGLAYSDKSLRPQSKRFLQFSLVAGAFAVSAAGLLAIEGADAV